ncbi:MAG: biotin/lipoyl-containing protein [Deferribacterales bacterium]
MKLKITVHGVAYEVDVEVLDEGEGFPASPLGSLPHYTPAAAPQQTTVSAAPVKKSSGGSSSVDSPIAGIVVELKTKPGDSVKTGDVILIMEAMKMKTSIAAPIDGKIKAIPVAVGDNIREGQTLAEYE